VERRFDEAVHHVVDRWCSLFRHDALVSMEHYKDLKAYYKKSFGNDLAYHVAVPLLHDLLDAVSTRRRSCR